MGPPGDDQASSGCLDPSSGLYRSQHLRLSLAYELGRANLSDKPLGLVRIRLPESDLKSVRVLAAFLKKVLLPLDTPARLGEREVAILLPEVDRDRPARLLRALAERFGDGGTEALAYGLALARPWEDWTTAKLLAKAGARMGPASHLIERELAAAFPFAGTDTALAPDEKESLFDGFTVLAGQNSSGRGPDPGVGRP